MSLIDDHVMFDTKSLIELFEKENKGKSLDNVMINGDKTWKKYFNIDGITKKDYVFCNTITTNGFEASLHFAHKDYYNTINNKKIIKSTALKKLNGLTVAEKIKIKEENLKLSLEIKEKCKQEKKKINDINRQIEKDKLSKMTKEEKNKYKLDKKIKKQELMKEKQMSNQEFKYITQLNEKELKHINNYSKLMGFIDPGKRDLIYLMTNDGRIFTYSNSQRLSETRQFEYRDEKISLRKTIT
jgi:hypothetical protein